MAQGSYRPLCGVRLEGAKHIWRLPRASRELDLGRLERCRLFGPIWRACDRVGTGCASLLGMVEIVVLVAVAALTSVLAVCGLGVANAAIVAVFGVFGFIVYLAETDSAPVDNGWMS